MFDTILGLPVHPLVVHAVVVLGPLTALLALLYASVNRLRSGLRWPLLLGALVTLGTAFVAKESGEALFVRVASSAAGQDAESMATIATHQSMGEQMFLVAVGFAVVVVLSSFLVRTRTKVSAVAAADDAAAGTAPPAKGSAVHTVMTVLLIVSALALLGASARAGHSGATAVWGDLISG